MVGTIPTWLVHDQKRKILDLQNVWYYEHMHAKK
jgi:hypothetical protein